MRDIRRQIEELFCAAADLRGCTAQVVADGAVRVTRPMFGSRVYYMENLVRKAAAVPPADWAALVADHLGTGMVDDEVEPLTSKPFAELRALVRTRLYPESDPADSDCVRRPIAFGLEQRVVLDAVHVIYPITQDMLAGWPVDAADVFALAEAGTRADGPVRLTAADFPAGVPPWFLLSGGDYTSAHALWLGDYPELTGRAGAVFAVPAESSLYAAPFDGVDVLDVISFVLGPLTLRHFEQDPWPTSPHVYRWHEGRITPAVYVAGSGENGLILRPTDEFLAVFDEL
ncbi:hypothetical protein [Nocardia stercoris]|uniref:Uncharacterized protein n=1 Tax=Nocardia stercoris TaxID=2483361 RepID=A0A3M2L7L4_9NOCA|nr:hypothetical protein [Nocardia stercoris]RMI33619.1 hypothetical protein EBN03_11005 [Nocardia stercoris]